MDKPREGYARKVKQRRIIYGVIAVTAIALVTVALANLEPAAPSVDASTLWIEPVLRGEMVRAVRGPGTLVPEETRWVSAVTEGRVERLVIKPGTEVTTDTVIMELSDPAVKRAALDAELQLQAAEADYRDLEIRLQSDLLSQQASAAAVEADFDQARLEAESNEELAKDGLISSIELRRSQIRAKNLATRHEIEQERLLKTGESLESQLGAQKARLEQAKTLRELRVAERDSLFVRSPIAGVLQETQVEEGQQVTPGTLLARVAEPSRLKAELRIAETQAKDIAFGQIASIDTRNGIIEGRVERVDPAAQDGTVTVDVELLGALPKGARPQLSVDGTIEIERLEDVLYTGRPAYGQAFSKVGMFKVIEDGTRAVRVQVELGRTSVKDFEIVSGLAEGDRVILSDTSAYDDTDRLRLVN